MWSEGPFQAGTHDEPEGRTLVSLASTEMVPEAPTVVEAATGFLGVPPARRHVSPG
jgi:hypothetical protein